MKTMIKKSEDERREPTLGDAIWDSPIPRNSKERQISRKSRSAGIASGGVPGAVLGAIGGPGGSAAGGIAGGLAGGVVGGLRGNKKILDRRHQRGEPLYSEEENKQKLRSKIPGA